MDIAELGLSIDSGRNAKRASDDLDKLAGAAGRAERQATRMTGASDRMSRMLGAARKVAIGLAAGLGTVAAAFSVMLRSQINQADQLSKMSQQVGIHVRELSALKHAADLSGVSLDGVASSAGYLARAMRDSLQGGSSSAVQALERLGISATDGEGRLRSISDVMADAADRFARMEDGAEKSALAMDLFGRSGRQLIPMLNQGRDGLQSMMAEAERLGIVLKNSTAQAAEAFNDNLTRLNRVKDGFVMRIMERMLPSLELLSEKLFAFADNEEAVKAAVEGMSGAFEWVARQIAHLAILTSRLNVEIRGLMEAFSRLGSGDFSGALEAFTAGQSASAQMRDELNAFLDNVFDGSVMSQGAIDRRINAAFRASGEQAGAAFNEGVEDALGNMEEAANVAASAIGIAGNALEDAAEDGIEAWRRWHEENRRIAEDITRYWQGVANNFVSTFTRGIESGKSAIESLRDAALSMLQDIARQMIQMATNRLISGLLGSLFGGFSFAGPWGGAGSGGGLGGAFPAPPASMAMASQAVSSSAIRQTAPVSVPRVQPAANTNQSGGVRVSIQNYGTSKEFDVQQISADEVRVIARDEADRRVTEFSGNELPYRVQAINRNPRRMGT